VIVVAQLESLPPGWANIGDGKMMREISKFTQNDIDSGLLFYQHRVDTEPTTADSFTFQVSSAFIKRPMPYQLDSGIASSLKVWNYSLRLVSLRPVLAGNLRTMTVHEKSASGCIPHQHLHLLENSHLVS